MKSRRSICIFLYLCISFFSILALGVRLYSRPDMKNKAPLPSQQREEEVSQETAPKFMLVDENGLVVVYYNQSQSKYLETGILTQQLPEAVQTLVKKGLAFSDEKSLFDFLENYSS